MLRVLRWVVVGVLAAGVTAAVAVPADDAADDLHGLRRDVGAQLQVLRDHLAVSTRQLETARRQLRVAEEQRDISKEQLAVAHRQLEVAEEQVAISRRMLDIAEAQLERTSESVTVQRQLLLIARRTLEQTREINRETPDLEPGA